MAANQDITEEQNVIDENNIAEDQNTIEEQKMVEEFNNISVSEPDPPDQPTMTGEDNDQDQVENNRTEQGWPMHERCVHGEINDICVPLDKSDVFFRIADPFERLPLSHYYFREWSEVEHIFMPLIEFVEEMNDELSPCPSPTGLSV